MKIKILSDLHIDISPYQDLPLEESKDTVLLLAGDICEVYNIELYEKFISTLSPNYKMILIIFGNHEFYNGSIVRAPQKLKENLEKFDNVKILVRESIVIEDVTFIGATLWTDFNKADPVAMWEADRRMNDFRYIRCGDNNDPYKLKFKANNALNEHIKDLNFIKKAVSDAKTSKIIVMTHHVPCNLSICEKYKSTLLNFSYVTALEDYIYDSGINYWIHGHTHSSSFYNLENTTIVANPRGYGKPINLEKHKQLIINPDLTGSGMYPLWELYDNENIEFNPNLVLDI
jgi:predicted phosphohydrolase